ncbi:hypothetical protein Tco_0256998 [Tanacetum coccineum]
MEKLESENVSLEFQVQSLIKERENVTTEYQKLIDSIKRTRTQPQREINELIENVNQKTYAYVDVRAKNQDLLITISELKAKLKNVEKVAGDGVASIKRRRNDLSSDGVRNLATTSGHGRLKEDPETSTWRRRQDYKATPSHLKAQIKQLKKKAKPVISHHNAWIKSISMKKRLSRKKSLKTKLMQKEFVSKQGRKPAKYEPTVHKDLAFDDLDDAMDYMEPEDAHDKGTVKDSTTKPNEGTVEPNEGTAEPKDGNSDESAAPTTIFRDDETIAQFLVTMSQNKTKQKGFEIKEIKDTDRPRTTTERSILTLKPLPKIDPKDKGKKVLEEKAESDAKQKVQEEWETEEEKKKLVEEEATKATLIRDYDDIQARVEADSILAARLQEEEREKFIIEERAKLLHDNIAAQRRFLAQQIAAEIRKIQVLYEKVKSSDENFVAIDSAEDERIIRELYKKAAGIKKADSIKEESKEEVGTRKRKIGTRKKMKSMKRRFRHGTSEDEKENDELKLCLTIAPDEDKEVDYEILNRKYPIIEFNKEDLNVVYKLVMDIYQNEVPEGFDRVLWGDLMIMFNPNDEDEFWNTQQDWNVVSWKLHRSSGVHTLMTDTGLVIHMLVEKKYPLRRKVLLQMLELKLESEEDSTMALELIRFVKKLIAELEPEDSDGNEEDL